MVQYQTYMATQSYYTNLLTSSSSPYIRPWLWERENTYRGLLLVWYTIQTRAFGPCELNKPFHLTTVSLLLKVHKNNNYKISYVSTPSKSLLMNNLTKVRPLFTLLHRGSDNSPLLIVFNPKYIDQSMVTFMQLKVG